jgi:membrane protein
MVTSAFWDFFADDALTQAGAVAFYTALSFAPLLMLATFLFSNLDHLAGTGTERRVVGQVQSLMGGEAGRVVEEVRREQEEKQVTRGGYQTLTGVLGILVLIWSASGVFVQLQAALDRIWDVEQAPEEGVRGWLRSRGLSMTVVFAVLFLLLASLIVTAMINAIFGGGQEEGRGTLLQIVHFVVSAAIYTALFAMIFKFLPDVLVPWRVVWLGALVTTGLFILGQFLIGLYLGKANPASAYGAAGSVVVMLIWVYYSAIILFFGAELTQAWAKQAGLRIVPSQHARPAHSAKEEPANEGAVDRRAKERR